MAMPIVKNKWNNMSAYVVWYTGFDNGLSYFQPGPYNKQKLGDISFVKNTNLNCISTGFKPNNGYDPRCRVWY